MPPRRALRNQGGEDHTRLIGSRRARPDSFYLDGIATFAGVSNQLQNSREPRAMQIHNQLQQMPHVSTQVRVGGRFDLAKQKFDRFKPLLELRLWRA